MTPITPPWHFLLAAVRGIMARGRLRSPLFGARIRPALFGAPFVPSADTTGGSSHAMARHGPIQITTIHGETMYTLDGVPVQVTAKLAWSSTLDGPAGPHRHAGRSAFDKNPGGHDEVSAQALAREALRTTVPRCGLGMLLCERHDAEEQVRLSVARQGEPSGLIVHLVRIRSVDIPAPVQAADDTRALLAIRGCVGRHRQTNRGADDNPAAPAFIRLAC